MKNIQKSGLSMNFSLADEDFYLKWRHEKLDQYPSKLIPVSIKNPYNLSSNEYNQICHSCYKTNMVIYKLETKIDKAGLLALAAQFDLSNLDKNLCANDDGITALEVNDKHSQKYIPYTNRSINWHTDGYYNILEKQIHAFLLHCVQPAMSGGENALLDPEIVYIKLRDENPEYIAALMDPTVMTIPPNAQVRPVQTGPVFSFNESLHMRYTARTHSIKWKPKAKEALEFLSDFLNSDSPYIFKCKLESNQGVLCNNVLHSRTAFIDDINSTRLLYRLRFYDRIVLLL
jgi:alpha-ketoglutarate-dependent taurine dioxygenase